MYLPTITRRVYFLVYVVLLWCFRSIENVTVNVVSANDYELNESTVNVAFSRHEKYDAMVVGRFVVLLYLFLRDDRGNSQSMGVSLSVVHD